MDYIVHIGVNKTGTSSLQRAFYDNRAALRSVGICYPETGTVTAGHHSLSRVIKGTAPEQVGLAPGWEDALAQETEGAETVVLSSENFATIPDPEPLVRLCPPGRTRVVIYVREHAAHTVSWYQQAIQGQNTSMSLEEFAEHNVVAYADLAARWAKVYGKENILMRPYDRHKLAQGDVVVDFSQVVRPGIEELFAGQAHDSNPSLAGNLLFIKRLLNCMITLPEARLVAHEIAAMTPLDPTFQGKISVPEATVARIRFRARRDREALARDWGLSVPPAKGAIHGSASPDLTRLGADLDRIARVAREKRMRLAEYFDRLDRLRPPVAAPAHAVTESPAAG